MRRLTSKKNERKHCTRKIIANSEPIRFKMKRESLETLYQKRKKGGKKAIVQTIV